jgi:CheY-like chemotaxis protein
MDVQMPKMDGLAATRAIRLYETELGLERSAIYGLTAHVLESDFNRCLTAGMTGHIGKPIEFDLLRQALQKHFEGGQEE